MADDPKNTPYTKTPLVEQLINTVVDGAAELTKSAAIYGVERVTQKAKATKAGKVAVAATKKVKKAAAKKKSAKKAAPKRSAKKSKKKSAKKTKKKRL
jgi:hypothetical protein